MCDPTHPISKHVGIIIDVNRQELEQEVLAWFMLYKW